MFEHHQQPLLPRRAFLRRLGRFAGAALLLVAASWLSGIASYHLFEGMAWIDAILNTAFSSGRNLLHPAHTLSKTSTYRFLTISQPI